MSNHDPKCHAYGFGPGQRMDICICTGIRIGRADEQDKAWRRDWRYAAVRAEVLAEVLADLKAMPIQVVNMQPIPGKPDDFREAVLLADVLALFGEEVSDE